MMSSVNVEIIANNRFYAGICVINMFAFSGSHSFGLSINTAVIVAAALFLLLVWLGFYRAEASLLPLLDGYCCEVLGVLTRRSLTRHVK